MLSAGLVLSDSGIIAQDTRISRGDGGSVFVLVKDVSFSAASPPATTTAIVPIEDAPIVAIAPAPYLSVSAQMAQYNLGSPWLQTMGDIVRPPSELCQQGRKLNAPPSFRHGSRQIQILMDSKRMYCIHQPLLPCVHRNRL